ncbi:4-phosphopantetheinyl transferase [Bacillus cereus]|uniref:4'-phosphopantetheinyl transferase family protein n=1 Tax=Bacillus cereus TaxID=1396 RepID=UPI000BFB9A19|nr:4'-phosphopantetheinyl transferase superfamily protein [Bacillus cereus]PGS41332.1 4-phosphopantetheinyl transferase [Bacillus cereus]PGU41515.1 4-phosphopantetheinyl transferase [Bacillus cereus]
MKIYVVNIENINEDMFNHYTYNSFLSEYTLSKARKFNNFKDTVRTTIGELLLRYLLEKHGCLNGLSATILRNLYGKPYLEDTTPNLHFNISHSGEWVVCIIDNNPVGIDIEMICEIDVKNIISLFHPFEANKINEAPDMINYFYNTWTVKESVLKLTGKGLSLPLKSFYIEFLEDGPFVNCDSSFPDDTNFHVKMYDFAKLYKLAVCSINKNFPSSVVKINVMDILDYFKDKQKG